MIQTPAQVGMFTDASVNLFANVCELPEVTADHVMLPFASLRATAVFEVFGAVQPNLS